MAEITAKEVKALRDATNVSMMECKKALQEANGDMDAAMKVLRERGMAVAAKKASRVAKDGKVQAMVSDDAQQGCMFEVNCETDFVTRNDSFKEFVAELGPKAMEAETGTLAETMKDEVTAKIAEIGENIVLRRNEKWTVQGTGAIASYVHLGGKVGVLVEIGCEKAETVNNPIFQEVAKDLTLHIAAAMPQYLCRDEVPAALVEEEKDIARKQLEAEGKPANIIENILVGKINKFCSQICLIEQAFVKDDKVSITKLLEEKGKELGDTLTIKRYCRYQLGAE